MASPDVPNDLPEMEYRFVGRSGLQVSAISLGGWLTYGGHVGDGTLLSFLQPHHTIDAGLQLTQTQSRHSRA